MCKKYGQVLFLLAMVIILAGCAQPTATAPEPTSVVTQEVVQPTATGDPQTSVDAWAADIKAKYGGTTINVAFGTHPSTDAFKKMADDFTTKTGIAVKWDIMEDAALYNKQLLEFTAHSAAYDVLMMDGFWISDYVPKGVVLSLDDLIADPQKTPAWFDYEDILPAFRNGLGKYQGKIYGIPTAGESRFLAYRKDLFEKYNQKVPTNLDEMLQVAEFFNGKEAGLYGMAFRAQRGIYFASGWLTLVYNFGDGFIDQKNWTSRMSEADVAQSLEYFVKLLNTCPPDVLNYTHEEATSAFVTGKTAMWYDATALVPWLEDPSRSQIAGKIGYAPPPPGPAGDGGVLAGWTMALSADTKNKEAAWAFVVYMTSKANAKTYINNGGVPSRTSSLKDPEFQASNPSAEAQLGAFAAADALVQRGLNWIPQTPVIIKALDRIGYYGSAVAAGEMEIAEAMQQADEEVKAILSEAP
mgnify:CR=1 FL=1